MIYHMLLYSLLRKPFVPDGYPIFLCIVKNIIFRKHNIIIEHYYINNTGSMVNRAPSSAAESK